jgi:hypothetical protein
MANSDMFPGVDNPSLYGPNSKKYFTAFNKQMKDAYSRYGITAESSRDDINAALSAAHASTSMIVGMTEREASKADQEIQKDYPKARAIKQADKLSKRTDKRSK